jgi:Domain of unknown function (DUF6438)
MRIGWSAVAVLAAACSSAPPPSAPPANRGGTPAGAHTPLATLERTACFGWCPVYKLTIFRDGVVEYDGDDYVKTRGHAVGHLPPETLDALDRLFLSNHYLDLAPAYEDYDVTDLPSTNTSYTPAGGATKAVRHYHGDHDAPAALTTVEDAVDRLVHVEQWIGSEAEREKLGRGAP